MSLEAPKIKNLVLDAGPLITQSASSLLQHSSYHYTTPGVLAELKDKQVRQQLVLWGDKLKVKHPAQEYITKVTNFSKLTGDYSVLSTNDIHIIALAYELEVEENNGDWRLRSYPGEVKEFRKIEKAEEEPVQEQQEEDQKLELKEQIESTVDTKKKPRRRGGKRQREKREAALQKELDAEDEQKQENKEQANDKETEEQIEQVEEQIDNSFELSKQEGSREAQESQSDSNSENIVEEEFDEEDDDGDWITPENLKEEILKDENELIQESKKTGPFIKVALSTGDFACQNVAMQIGLNLMNSMSGKQIKRVRNYMYRCHACFRLTPIPKDGTPKHFCPKCGGNTLLRCAVSIDNTTGKVTPHLKSNFQWIKRGEKYSLPSPLSKNQIRLAGKAGFQHNKQNRHKTLQNPLILREDQKEYQQALKDDEWQRRTNDKILQQWVGGGSADNYISPFNMNTVRQSGVSVGKGRYVNSSKGKKK
jgi:RNA-binding protein NOB1